ncbi:DUF6268 family outer membrane beta-barrel protein [Arenibacter palladensis]|uniref:DUF6268 family outer membrane beta-barrel protein n=1 Tax=Arenibacter palladensis TaxID=237373 RepID=UPI0026E17826|nr:DUF6268 family outer membrane beta-barrel protein [Arenibacter palladensis]MDO6604812.1 DUF6268 family outer membrane beta-barrel protein [Arenibacter palladensis]
MGIRIKGWEFLLGFFLSINYCLAQTPDVFRLEYMLMPRNTAEAKLSRIKLVANLPIKVGKNDNIIVGGEYNRIEYDLNRRTPYDDVITETFHVADLNMAYILQYNQDWRFVGVVTPRLSSTLTNDIGQGDVSVNMTIGALRDRPKIEKPTRLVLGIAYNSTVAVRVPLPLVYYEKRFHPNWAYVVGAPKSGMKYFFNDNHMLQTEFILDGYYVNLQNTVISSDSGVASSISTSVALFTLGYQYAVAKNIFFYGYAGHTLFQAGVLRDEDRKDIFTLNDQPSFYFRTGFRIGI